MAPLRRSPNKPPALPGFAGGHLISSLGYVLRLFARHGGVVLAQRMLFGESAADQQLSVMLTAARVALTQVSALFEDQFFADANAVIEGYRPRPPGGL